MKKCKICKVEYNLDFFYKSGKYHFTYCKKCHGEKSINCVIKKYGTSNIRKTPYVDSLRKSDKEYQRKRRKDFPLLKKERVEKYKKDNPEKIKAQSIMISAIRKGILIRDKCRDCERLDTHGHHPNYNKPLKVVWLCPSHHKLEHSGRNISK